MSETPAPARGLFVRLHEAITKPPRALDEEWRALFAITNWAMWFGLFAHSTFILVFWVVDVRPMVLFNLGSVAWFVVCILLARTVKLHQSLLLASAEVTAHAFMSTYYLGWESGFHFYVIIPLVMVVMFRTMSAAMRVGLAVSLAGSYLALALYGSWADAVMPRSETTVLALTGINTFTAVGILCGVGVYYVWSLAQTRVERDEAEAKLQVALDTTRKLSQAKTEFTSTVSHELRTPLTSVIGFAKLIRRTFERHVPPLVPTDDPRATKAVAQIKTNLAIVISEGERLTALINDLLDIAKMEAGQMVYREEVIDPETLVTRAIEACTGLFLGDEVELLHAVDDDLPPLRGDPDRLLQVLINLVSNSAKFTERGSVSVLARLGNEGGLSIAVRDTGPGIPDESLARVFEKFGQVDGSGGNSETTGTGLGLAISRRIVSDHGGTIGVTSTLGEGTEFEIRLPAA
jgi:signal transduction histidine kinase